MNKPAILLPLFLLSATLLIAAETPFDEEHWLSDHQGFNEVASKNVNDSLDKAVSALVAKLIADEKGHGSSIAVAQFLTQDNKMTMLGKIISIKLVKALAASGKFNPVDEDLAFIAESSMGGLTKLIDDKTVQKAGKMLGVSHVLIGSIDAVGEDVVLNSRLIDMALSKVQSAAQASFPTGPGIKHLLQYQIEFDPAEESDKKYSVTSKKKSKSAPAIMQDYYEANYILNNKEKRQGVSGQDKSSWEKRHHIIVFTPKGYQEPYKSFHEHGD